MSDAELIITPLGAGQEVGRSCILLQYKNRNVMLDCGSHPGRQGIDSLPFFDKIEDISQLDLILITHFHIDHCAALPYFTEKTNFQGKIFMTHATKAVMKLLLSDNVRMNTRSTRPLYTEAELSSCIAKIETIDFHQTVEHRGIKFVATAAGHVLGAAMFNIEIDGKRIFYTGDYSMKPDRHLLQAEVPVGSDPPNVMIVESTFGTTSLPSREDRETQLVSTVDTIVRRGGSCLIPVFALGRAQELLLILDEYWQQNPDLHGIPVFYASKLAAKALRVYQTFINMMNDHVRTMMDMGNPFHLSHVKNMMRTDFDAMGACVVMASPGFLQDGVSRHLFERWCDDERNGVIIAGYSVEGTLAHHLLSRPKEITCVDNVIKKCKCQIENISFSAHVDFNENLEFIKSVHPDYIILVHGEKTGMRNLKDEIEREVKRDWPTRRKPPIEMPENGIATKIKFPKSILAECVGSAGSIVLKQLEENDKEENMNEDGISRVSMPESSILVVENFISKIVTVDELSYHSSCRIGKIKQRILVPIPNGMSDTLAKDRKRANNGVILRAMIPYLEEVFEGVTLLESTTDESNVFDVSILIQGVVVLVEHMVDGQLNAIAVEWQAAPTSDMISDCAVGILLQALSTNSLLRRSMSADNDTGIGLGNMKKRGHTHYMSQANTETKSKNVDENNSTLKRLKSGDVDPSKAIPQDVRDMVLSTSEDVKEEAAVKLHLKRLEKLKSALLKLTDMKEEKTNVSISADHMKLIFSSGANREIEAYCIILFNSSGEIKEEFPSHDAVIKCDDEEFKQVVLSAFHQLKN